MMTLYRFIDHEVILIHYDYDSMIMCLYSYIFCDATEYKK